MAVSSGTNAWANSSSVKWSVIRLEQVGCYSATTGAASTMGAIMNTGGADSAETSGTNSTNFSTNSTTARQLIERERCLNSREFDPRTGSSRRSAKLWDLNRLLRHQHLLLVLQVRGVTYYHPTGARLDVLRHDRSRFDPGCCHGKRRRRFNRERELKNPPLRRPGAVPKLSEARVP